METHDLCFLYFVIPWPLGEGFSFLYFEASSHWSNMVSYSLYEYKKYIYNIYYIIYILYYIYIIYIYTIDE